MPQARDASSVQRGKPDSRLVTLAGWQTRVCVCVCVRARACVCVRARACVCVRAHPPVGVRRDTTAASAKQATPGILAVDVPAPPRPVLPEQEGGAARERWDAGSTPHQS